MNDDMEFGSRSQWESNIIQANGSSKRSRGHQWFALALLIGFAAFVLYDSRDQLLEHYVAGEYTDMSELMVLIIPTLFLFILIKKSYKRSQFGETPLVMNPMPAVLGDAFSGHVEIQKGVEGLQFKAELLLMHRQEVYDKGSPRSRVDVVWKKPLSLHQERAMIGTRLLLKAELPVDQPPSQPSHSDDSYAWQLAITSHDKSFRRKWNIPVVAETAHV